MLDSPDNRAAERVREGDNVAAAAADELAALRRKVDELTHQRDSMLQSTIWRASAPWRALGGRLPAPLLRAVRAPVRAGLRLLRGQAAPVPVAALPPPAPAGVVANRVIFVSGEPTTPGHVYRVVRQADAAAQAGWEASWMPIQQAPRRMDEIATAAVVVVWRATWSNTVEWILHVVRKSDARLVFDLDDLVFRTELANVETIDGIRSQQHTVDGVVAHFADMQRAVAAADACSCTTTELARHLREYDKTAFVIPNGFDAAALALSRLAVRRRRAAADDGLVRIGYAAGSRTHQRDFAQAAGAVARVLAERPQCRLVLFETPVGAHKLLDVDEFAAIEARPNQVEWWPMRPLTELPEAMARFDINLAPLEAGNPFCEAKSELKYFEAALVEVPTVASPTGPLRRAIRDGVTGFLAATEDDWYGALIALVDDAALRRRVAHAAYLDVLWPYGPERRAERLLAMLRQVQGGAEGARAFTLELARQAAAPVPPALAESDVVFAADRLGQAQVCVVVPLYNYSAYIVEALESVAAQTLAVLDLVVVDDCSTDDSLALARDWAERNHARFNRILVLRNRANAGLARTRNAGFDAAETPFVLPLDADNRLLPDCCARTLDAALAANAAFAYPAIRCFGGDDKVFGIQDFMPTRLAGGNFVDAMALVLKSAWAAVGGYAVIDPPGWEDFDLWCRFAERSLLGVKVAEVLAEYRVHEASMLHTETDVGARKLKVIGELEARHAWLSVPYRDWFLRDV
jgi:glycosyltransferase involved in cell wall biosynthesis